VIEDRGFEAAQAVQVPAIRDDLGVLGREMGV
jgi:hypothetical protein